MKTRLLLFLFILAVNSALAQTPVINQKIVDYVKTVIGTRVDRGECWDLAHEALTLVNAQWDHKYKYGDEVNPGKDSIYPGDLIHFDRVTLSYKKGKALYTEDYPQHTAIVYRVLGPGEYEIAHQNTSFSGKKVGLSILRLKDKRSGKWKFYRPKAG
jgi:hypothetical protein